MMKEEKIQKKRKSSRIIIIIILQNKIKDANVFKFYAMITEKSKSFYILSKYEIARVNGHDSMV
jgi:hypothetical protein